MKRTPMNSSSNANALSVILPMRAGSKRIRGKNTRLMAGKPLFLWLLEAVRQVELVSDIVITTDLDGIGELIPVGEGFSKIRIVSRPAHLAGDECSMNDVIDHALDFAQSDAVMQVHATSPLLKAPTLALAAETFFLDGLPSQRSLMGVTRFEGRLWTSEGEPENHNPENLIPSQAMPKLLLDCSAFYLFTKAGFSRHNSRTYGPPILHEIEELEAWDVDYEWQFKVAARMLEEEKSG
jgi:CMP-N-acetylneuraminic acid synthetase